MTVAPAPLPAIEVLREPFRSGSSRPRAWRLQQLQRIETLLGACEQEVLEALAADLGKPPVEAYFELVAVKQELRLAQRQLRRWMAPRPVNLPLSQRPGRAQLIAEPLGCVLIIGPWNYPFSLTLQPLVSALAAGNTAVLKPSEHAPRTSALISELVDRYFDPSVVAVVEGDGAVAAELLELPFDHIFFTGGGRVGRLVMAAAARHLTPVTLELGGKSPAIVLADADLAVTARRIAWGKGLNAGQTCIAPDHLLVEEAVRPALIAALQAEFLRAYGSDPLQSADLARIVNRAQFDRLSALLEGARQRGQILAGGQSDAASLRIAPTLLAVERTDDPLMAEELFGPLLPVLGIGSLEEAIRRIRSGPKPLALYLFGRSAAAQEAVLAGTSSGGVCFNDVVMQVGVPELPFGGIGASGMGTYHGKAGFDTFSHQRSVLRRPFRLDLPFRYPPYGDRLGLIKRLLG
ncbi:aldehyde dehydrogenase family protein [Synechococcus sp. Tobar12-5m-g]|jgi:aldehyde dehydrogenase (NAD+)|uniref:aldehyde dehydrogenase family protein n=1 Tax=unclassified Synechococcus TaxID=2626047 RepID=UPI0020CD9530|nr:MULTISPECIES: aldehyde dehydrogenase family protein [unclassified Synechococcus]MCP9773318.1 aldehyde dehydrogenase family protein [Synechococcus sp. Tobar12-5m-g]MCP9874196.1 aldehyde dehydrogenase family protein [Synechococcus sp. Cruz CV-v-12]